jgi:hypothetical protein
MYDDEQLQHLIAQICRQEPKLPPLIRQKALSRLLLHIQRSPGLWRDPHQDYAYALNRTLEWACQNICTFEPAGHSVQESLIRWVNGYLKWRVHDLKGNKPLGSNDDRTGQDYRAILKLGFAVPIELDKVISEGQGSQTSQGSLTADPKSFNTTLLDQLIEQSQQQYRQQISEQIRAYLKTDPHEVLRACHPRRNADCHCQELVLRMHLSSPGETLRAIAKQFGVNEQALYSHWRYKCIPLMQLVALRHDPQIKEYIEHDSDGYLSQNQLENQSDCSCLELGKKLLLSEVPVTLGTVAKTFGVKESTLADHWQTQCLPLLRKNQL